MPGGIRIVGVNSAGERVAEDAVRHGDHPELVMARRGFALDSAVSAELSAVGALELTYAVSRLHGIPPPTPVVRRDAGLADDDVGEPYQRVAAYAVVVGEPGVLLTQFNSRTALPGRWGPPGGGLDPGESPVDGVHREVWEETGQRIELGALTSISSQHWVGRSPTGVVEDFHAMRLVYRATCPAPTEIVIHDVGGTTSAARWVPFDQLASVDLAPTWRRLPALTNPAEG